MSTGISISRRQSSREEFDKLFALLDAIQEECQKTPNPWFGRTSLGTLQLRLLDRVKSLYKEEVNAY